MDRLMCCQNRSSINYNIIRKSAEFKERLKILLNAGGMMSFDCMKINGKNVVTLSSVDYDEEGNIELYYNYYDDNYYEPVIISKHNPYLHIEKVERGVFGKVIDAVNCLQAIYTNEKPVPVPSCIDTLVSEKNLIGWFNNLFNENYSSIHWDRWETFLKYHRKTDFYNSQMSNPDDMPTYEPLAVYLGINKIVIDRHPISPLETVEVLQLASDDMLYYWTKDDDPYISYYMKDIFTKLNISFQRILKEETPITKGIDWIIEILYFVRDEYTSIFVFTDFLNETIMNIKDQRYLALWKLFEDICHNPTMLESASVLFELDPQTNNKTLIDSWESISREKKFNYARVLLRRYMALVANKELRKKVFGF